MQGKQYTLSEVHVPQKLLERSRKVNQPEESTAPSEGDAGAPAATEAQAETSYGTKEPCDQDLGLPLPFSVSVLILFGSCYHSNRGHHAVQHVLCSPELSRTKSTEKVIAAKSTCRCRGRISRFKLLKCALGTLSIPYRCLGRVILQISFSQSGRSAETSQHSSTHYVTYSLSETNY